MAVAAKAEPVKFGEAVEREVKPVRPQDCVVNWAGQKTKSVIVIAPDGFQLSDLNEHSDKLWKLVQTDRHRGIVLGEDDEVAIRCPDKRIFARVNYADSDKVLFYDIKSVSKPQRDAALWSDGTYEVRWVREGGYSYFRSADGVRLSNPTWSTAEAARSACIREQYPVRA